MLGHEVLLSKSSRALLNFSVSVRLISFALLDSFILSKGGRDESALQNNYSPSPHSKCSKIIDLFAVGEALLEKKMAGRPTLFAQRMKGESGFLGLLYPPAKKLLNNMLCFPRALLKKKKGIIYQLHSIPNYIRIIRRLVDKHSIPSVDASC